MPTVQINFIDSVFEKLNINTNIVGIYQFGSHLYKTNTDVSDFDYIIVVDDIEGGYKQYESPEIDLHIYSKEYYLDALKNHKIEALEMFFQEPLLKVEVDFELDKWKLRKEISSICNNSWVKCKKKLQDDEKYIAIKSLYHHFRILDLGIQIAKSQGDKNKVDLTKTRYFYEDIKNTAINSDYEWEVLDKKYRSISKMMQSEFRELCHKPKQIKGLE